MTVRKARMQEPALASRVRSCSDIAGLEFEPLILLERISKGDPN